MPVTEIIKEDAEEAVEKAAALLKLHFVVAVPTETVYGLAANAYDEEAVKNIYAAKGRPSDNPLIFHISSLDMLYDLAGCVPDAAVKLAGKYWPGPLTMIFKKKKHVTDVATAGLDTVAVRMPANEFTLKLINKCGFPLAAPSANTSGLPSPTQAIHVFQDMNGKIPLIIDGGTCRYGVESTVICFEGEKIRLLRPGAVTVPMLEEIAPVIIDKAVLDNLAPGEKVISPGMKYKHYSPKAEVYIIDAANDYSFIDYVNAHYDEKTVVLAKNPSARIKARTLPYGENPEEEAASLFSSLRTADNLGAVKVFVQVPDKTGIGMAVYNRLLRAAAFKVITLKKNITKIIGLTGMSGAGKTTASRIFSENGFCVINCDQVARIAAENNQFITEAGQLIKGAVKKDGTLDRKYVADVIFNNEKIRTAYNKLIYPYISYIVINEVLNAKNKMADFILLDAPTLFESGLDDICDEIVSVIAVKDILIKRITSRDGITEKEAEARLNSQFDTSFYSNKSEYCAENNISEENFKNKIISFIKDIRQKYRETM